MFCAKCGKQIDDDSTFCPFCGQKVGAKVETEKPLRGVSERKPLLGGAKNSKGLIGIIAALAVIAVVSVCVVKLSGGKKTPLEKIFDMSWEESSTTSIADIREMLDEEGIIYDIYKDDGRIKDLWAKNVLCGFMGNSTYFEVEDYDGYDINEFYFEVVYETLDDYKKFRKDLDNYLNKRLINNSQVCSYDGEDGKFYYTEKSDKNKDAFSENYFNIVLGLEQKDVDLDNYSVYKVVSVKYEEEDEPIEWGDKTYQRFYCEIYVGYTLMSQEMYINNMAEYGYDAIKGKEIDIENFQKTLDKSFLEYLGIDTDEKDFKHGDAIKLYKIYMIETNNYDVETSSYLKTTDEEKRLWYIQNFEWDTEKKSKVDLSAYKNSADIYLAVECNYNADEQKPFEGDLDKALYLADLDYNIETGESFEGTDEERLYFMQNYGYDTSTRKTVDKEVVDALIAYQKYIDGDSELSNNLSITHFVLAYIDEDNIPELMLIVGTAGGFDMYVLSYQADKVIASEIYMGDSAYYIENRNLIRASGGRMGGYWDVLYRLINGELTKVAEGHYSDFVSDESYYEWNGEECSGGASDYNNRMKDFCYEQAGDTEWKEIGCYGDNCNSILAAYDASRKATYAAYVPEVVTFEMSDGILTFAGDDGSRFGWNNNAEDFSMSYPVAEDCIWETGHFESEFVVDEMIDYEWIKSYIEEEQAEYVEGLAEYGYDSEVVVSPMGIIVETVDGIVVRVYTSFS